MENEKSKQINSLSMQALRRMPSYLHYLRDLSAEGIESVSSAKAAAHFNFTEIQVRKDFSAVCPSKGKPKSGFCVNELLESIEDFLGFNNVNEAVIAGAGHLGKALLSYPGFETYGIKIIAAFDNDADIIGEKISGKTVINSDKISETCRRLNVHIGIITVPTAAAQTVCDQLVAGGVKAIWNFAPVQLFVPDGVLVQNENMAVSLAMLSRHLQENIHHHDN